MADYTLGNVEARFADIIWENEPMSSTELSKRAEEVLGWKKSTSYTVLKRLIEKGILKNEKGTVTSVIKKDELYSLQSEKFIDDNFDGSLPAFLAAFTARKALTEKEIYEIKKMISQYEEG